MGAVRNRAPMKDIADLSLDQIEKQIVFHEGLMLAAWQKYSDAPPADRVPSYLAETDTIRHLLMLLYIRREALRPTEH